ncbi:argininosuccinate lyase [uncultured Microscilla sp.]|uniref:argininosuccinate lyase n=1 Tax=uncultured Microscilla sp. TaxID=432653 RepID=UPI002613BBAC|nr:argininosuccinate lyase [uncultured Microscilla sp.]
MAKLWDKGANSHTEATQLIENFTVGKDRELDVWLAPFDVLGSVAHIRMLESIGLLDTTELTQLVAALADIYQMAQSGKFIIEEGIEDVHSQVEMMLTQKLGDVGKKIHSGRSRNDQVLLDLKLYMRHEIKEVVQLTTALFEQLMQLSNQHKNTLLPGYTHLQVAMPSSFGLWFGAYAESLTDDLLLLQAAYRIVNQNPLGSAAGYGSSFPLDRQMTTDLLGFERLNYNVVYAQMGRGKVEKNVAFALGAIGGSLAKMAMDVCLYMNQNFGFITFPDHLTTGSSIMPHKKNPDVFELIRAKGNKLQALSNEILMITANLPSGYHRDLQLIKENFLPAFADLKACLQIATYMFQHIQIKEDILKNEKYKYLFSVEEVNKQVLAGTPFREAYKNVGLAIDAGNFDPDQSIAHTHIGSIGNPGNQQVKQKMQHIVQSFDFASFAQALDRLWEL